VDATYKAIDQIVRLSSELLEFNVHAVTEGIDALGEVTVRLRAENGVQRTRTSPQSNAMHVRTFGGYGADTDIIVASAKAYLAALNKLLLSSHSEHTAEIGVRMPESARPTKEITR
jgi:2-isopropylmalate synthase